MERNQVSVFRSQWNELEEGLRKSFYVLLCNFILTNFWRFHDCINASLTSAFEGVGEEDDGAGFVVVIGTQFASNSNLANRTDSSTLESLKVTSHACIDTCRNSGTMDKENATISPVTIHSQSMADNEYVPRQSSSDVLAWSFHVMVPVAVRKKRGRRWRYVNFLCGGITQEKKFWYNVVVVKYVGKKKFLKYLLQPLSFSESRTISRVLR